MRSLLPVLFAIACSDTEPTPAESTALDDALAGHPDQATVNAAPALMAGLTAVELDHLVEVDWSTLTAEGFIIDPVMRKAVGIVEPLDQQKPTPHDGCSDAASSIGRGIFKVAASLAKSPLSVGTCASVLVTEGLTAPICLVASIIVIGREARRDQLGTTVKNAMDQCLCQFAPPCDLPDAPLAPDAPEL